MKCDTIFQGNNVDVLSNFEDECIDAVITSPPYDDLKTYNGFCFDCESLINQLFRVVKMGGVVVWIVNDAVKDGSETGSSFKQALLFKEKGFNIHDTMIWEKDSLSFPDSTRYGQAFEYMFIFSKGKPKTVNKICDRKNKWVGTKVHGTTRAANGNVFRKSNDKKTTITDLGARFNIWNIPTEKNNKTGHPAVFPVRLVEDHITSRTNEGDIILDPFMGSGTTAIGCLKTKRHYIGIEISKEYVEIATKRILDYKKENRQISIFDFPCCGADMREGEAE